MTESLTRPFTKAEMDAMRGRPSDLSPATETVLNDEAGLLQAVWRKIRQIGRRLPFAEDLVAAYFCATDPATPARVKIVLLGALAYFVLPTDALADFLPLVGFTDDAAVLAAAIANVASAITDAHRARARTALDDGSGGPDAR